MSHYRCKKCSELPDDCECHSQIQLNSPQGWQDVPVHAAPLTTVPGKELVERISDYLLSGGLFNPELMDHRQVRDLLIDCRDSLIDKQKVGANNG